MVRLSNGIIVVLNLVMALVACSAVGYSVWLDQNGKSSCEKTLQKPLLVTGAALLAVSLVGIVGASCRVSFFMWLYLVLLFVGIVGLTAFTIFGVIVTHGRIGEMVVEDESPSTGWLRREVVNKEPWEKITACLDHMKLCNGIHPANISKEYNLHPLKRACCLPPGDCQRVSYPDCRLWSDYKTQLCFRCEACREAFVEQIRGEWRMVAVTNTCFVVLVCLVYVISCIAMRNNQKEGYIRFRSESP